MKGYDICIQHSDFWSCPLRNSSWRANCIFENSNCFDLCEYRNLSCKYGESDCCKSEVVAVQYTQQQRD